MNTAHHNESLSEISARMASQRSQLQSQFLRPEESAGSRSSTLNPPAPDSTMQPYQPKSMLMKLLVANPQLLQRLMMLAATTALGARYSSWAVRLIGFFLAARKR